MTDKTEAMDNLIAQDADLIDTVTERVAEVTETDCNVAEYIAGDRARDLDYQVVALHRQHAYDQGYYDGCANSIVQSYALRGANQALRLGLYGIIDSDDADTIATTLEAGGEVDWSEYPESTHAALGHCK